ncbi:GTP-binding protein [Lentisphaera araneosa HTCC2155]|uniref:GTPase Obg n=1 Tax=Lentisphaera araneosa HTCC2155 TaxID=313628 RepID=A6DJA8_9BACT|nr:GTPase ObgE [Lentisphaera araneosa]EDM28544.1 GTP-binding protein [Lentisphaera araneosa HTCC2155]
MFVDRIKVYVKAGNGGNGCISFRREKYVPKGGPNGGNGGDGGSVIFVADPGTSSLVDLKFNQHIDAEHGGHGLGSDMHGNRGEDLYVKVPPGTVVMDINNDNYQICDLDEPESEIVIAQGGKGGRGNRSFATSINRVPRQAEEGYPGEELVLLLELKTIADVGLVGYPNAGKSTFLNSVSNSGAKTASYPFTTLNPIVGTIDFPDFTRITIADIPGLVEGAHENIGLGHHFLRHIERTNNLVYVLDMNGTDGRDPLDDLVKLKEELELYEEGLSDRACMILANKMDNPASEENLERLRKETDLTIFPVIAELRDGVDEVLEFLHKRVMELKKSKVKHVPKLKNIYRKEGAVVVDLEADGDDFALSSDDDFDFDVEDLDYDDFYDDIDEDEV